MLGYVPALLQEQVERKNKLERELRKEKDNLRTMQREVHEMRKDLEQRQRRKQTMSLPIVSTVLQKVHELRVEIQRLQEECKKMTQEVDLNLDSRVPLGETDEEFYKNIYTGQQGFILPPSSRPPAPRPARRLQHGDSADGPHWICTQCTFQNHPLLDKCETCEMPRLLLGTDTCYCHPIPTKPCLTPSTGNACGETASSWAVVNCGVINRMMWLTEQRCKHTVTLYLVCYWHCDYMYCTNNCPHWLLDAKCIVFSRFAPVSSCKVTRHTSPSIGSTPSEKQPLLLGRHIVSVRTEGKNCYSVSQVSSSIRSTVESWCLDFLPFVITHFIQLCWRLRIVLMNWDEITWLESQLLPFSCYCADLCLFIRVLASIKWVCLLSFFMKWDFSSIT